MKCRLSEAETVLQGDEELASKLREIMRHVGLGFRGAQECQSSRLSCRSISTTRALWAIKKKYGYDMDGHEHLLLGWSRRRWRSGKRAVVARDRLAQRQSESFNESSDRAIHLLIVDVSAFQTKFSDQPVLSSDIHSPFVSPSVPAILVLFLGGVGMRATCLSAQLCANRCGSFCELERIISVNCSRLAFWRKESL